MTPVSARPMPPVPVESLAPTPTKMFALLAPMVRMLRFGVAELPASVALLSVVPLPKATEPET